MDHAITIGDILKWALIAGGVFVVLSVVVWVIGAYGRGMSR